MERSEVLEAMGELKLFRTATFAMPKASRRRTSPAARTS